MKRALLLFGMVIVVLGLLSLLLGGDRRAPKNVAARMVGSVVLDSGAHMAVLRATEDLRIDGVKETFVPVGELRVAPNGNIVVPQNQDHNFRIFSPDGKQVGTLGGKGSGPGEIASQFNRTGWIGDTLWIWDDRSGRLTYASSTGKFIDDESFHVVFSAPKDLTRFPAFFLDVFVMAVAADGYLVHAASSPSWQPKSWAYKSPLLSVGLMGMLHGVVGDFPQSGDSDMVTFSDQPGNSQAVSVPFRVQPLFAIADDGRRLAYATTQIDGDRNGRVRLVVLSGRGDTLIAREYPFVGTPIPKPVADSAIAAQLRNMKPPQLADLFREEAPRRMHPVYAPIRSVRLGRDSTVWLSLWNPSQTRIWVVLDARGEPIGKLELPPGVLLAVAERSHVWTIQWDDDDVPSVVRYRLTGWNETKDGAKP